MLQIIVFSFNRALQLNTLLCSMTRCIEPENYTVDILYNVSSAEFAKGYDKLKECNKSNSHIHFIKENTVSKQQTLIDVLHAGSKSELRYFIKMFLKKRSKTNFRKVLLDLMTADKSPNVMFLTDDACFIDKTVIGNDILEWISSDPYNRQFSLRTGKGMNDEPKDVVVTGDYIEWEFYNHALYTLWGYPFSVDAHIYSKAVIVRALSSCYFNNPNSLEGFVSLFAQKKRLFGVGRAFAKTRILSFPINIVQNVASNESMNISVEKLNDYYLDGYSLEYPMPENITTFQVYPDTLVLNHPKLGQTVLTTK